MSSDMDIKQTTREQEMVEIDGDTFDKQSFANVVGTLKLSGTWKIGNTHIVRKLEDLGIARRVTKRDDYDMSVTGYEWTNTDERCAELHDQLTATYARYRIRCGHTTFGPWCESETDDAKERTEKRKSELEERNPDVSFRITEEKIVTVE